ncbi:MAG: Clp1/GlmU family protein, partial [Acidiferrobacterales bacterium]
EYSADIIIGSVLSRDRRVLLFGEPGIGKLTLASALARALENAGRRSWCIGADPGAPAFGMPGGICLGEWRGEHWNLVEVEALCTLDAGRFRLPLVSGVRRLAQQQASGILFVDAPGVVRGVGGAELLSGTLEAADIDVVLVLTRVGRTPPLPRELAALACEVFVVPASAAARRASKRERARQRTRLWDAYLGNAEERRIRLRDLQLVGTPPPIDVPAAWSGRQMALLDGSATVAMGEVLSSDGDNLLVRMAQRQTAGNILLVRDAERAKDGLLNTAKPFGSATLQYIPPPDVRPYPAVGSAGGPCPVARVGAATVTLVNGIFGDPLLHLRLRHHKHSLLFDLGDGSRLPARIAHQVTDVFISHAHIDHIGGFLWLLRSRIGDFPVCRIFGPPGMSGHIAGLISGIHWDRIGEHGPRFEVAELNGERLVRFMVQAGRGSIERIAEEPVTDGVLLEEPAFRVRAITLDHRTPVLAFAFEQPRQLNIRKDRLVERALPVGPWLGELKRRIASDERETTIRLPDGHGERAGVLADDLVLITPGQKLVYATDLADTADNRDRLTALAKGAHTFFCEATFIDGDAEQAARTGHLTARACGEIATAAGVEHLVPFHFSRRYENEPNQVYDEVKAVCSRVVMPR